MADAWGDAPWIWRVSWSTRDLPSSAVTLDDISGWFKNHDGGPSLQQLQTDFAKFCDSKYAFGVSSGSAAIYIALKACGIGTNDYVAVPTYTHVGSVAPIRLANAKPVFVDADEYGNISIDHLTSVVTRYRKLKAIIVVHQLGLPCHMKEIVELAGSDLFIIEDASHALGAEYQGKKAGVLGDIGCFSVGGGRTKTIGLGEGGMIVVNDDKLAEKCRNLRNHGDRVTDCRYFCFNFRMSDLNAAVGLIQMDQLDVLNKWQLKNAEYLIANLPDYLEVPPIPSHIKSTRYLVGCHFNQVKAGMTRNEFLTKLQAKGCQVGPRKFVGGGYSKLISDIRYYKRFTAGRFPVSEKLRDESVWIDWHRYPRTILEIDALLNTFKEVIESAH